MIGDNIHIKPEYFNTAAAVVQLIEKKTDLPSINKFTIIVGGESGSGKSVTAMCLQKILTEKNLPAYVLHQDDYFRFPPETNHQMRKENMNWVGENEVQLDILQQHLNAFHFNEKEIIKPIIHYKANIILQEIVNFSPYKILIIEGTYTFLLEHAQYYIFMDRTYQETYSQRTKRGRERPDAFIEKVLEIEHKLIRPLKGKADAIILKDYTARDFKQTNHEDSNTEQNDNLN